MYYERVDTAVGKSQRRSEVIEPASTKSKDDILYLRVV